MCSVSAYAEQVPGVVIDHRYASTRQYIGSPSIVIAPNGDYVASHDFFGPGASEATSTITRTYISKDRGQTWTQTAEFNESEWGGLFVLKGRVYLMSTSKENGRLVIRTSDDDGHSWSGPHYLTEDAGYCPGPLPFVIHDGRIYHAAEYQNGGPWGEFKAFMMWAPINSDLTKASSWSYSNRLPFPVGDNGFTWLEGNAVIAPDGSVLNILRVQGRQKIAILKLYGATLKLQQFADFPGGSTKFVIHFDSVSKLYWTLSNPALPGEPLAVSEPGSVRNTLAVMSSPDLIHWTPRAIVLHHSDARLYGFHYVDWQFDGSDIIVVSRTAFDDDQGGANSYHNANYLTFHRVKSFRRLGTVRLDGSPFTAAEVVSPQQIDRWSIATTKYAADAPSGAYSQPIGQYGNHATALVTRVKTGEAEQHRDWNDIFVVTAGEASLVSGGHLVDGHLIAPGENRGSSIEGGTVKALQPGSVVHIDAQIPHQLIINSGKSTTYFVVKVKVESAAVR